MKKQQEIVKEVKDRQYNYRLIEKDKVLASLHGYIIKPRTDSLSVNKIEGEQDALKTLGEELFKFCQDENLQIISNNLPEREEIVKFLYELGFKLKNSQAHYSLDLTGFEYKPVETLPFTFKSLDNLDEEFFKDLLYTSLVGDPIEALNDDTPDEHFELSKDYPTFNPAHWLLAYLDEKPVGFILANYNPDYAPDEVAGHMEYFSILPAFRNQGFGTQLHYYGMHYLKELGARVFYGNTSTENKGMNRLFEKSGCTQSPEHTFLFFKTK